MTSLRPSLVQRRYPVRYWLLVAYCVGMPNFVRFDASGRTHENGLFNPSSLSVIALTLTSAFLLAVMTLLNRQKIMQRVVRFDASLWLLLCANFVVSTFLSPAARLTPSKATDLPLALFRIGEWVLLFALLLSVYSREDEESATDLVVRVIASTCWINIAMVWFFLPIMPSLVYGAADDIVSAHARLGGALIHPVHLSVLAGIAFFHSLFFIRSRYKYACCGLAGVTLLLTYARSEQILFTAALFVYLVMLSRKTILRWFGFLGVLSAIALAGTFYETVLRYLERGQGVRNITTLSERTDVWKASLTAFRERPYLGYGYIIGVKNAIRDHWNATNWIPPHSHNEFIQTLVTGGIVAGVLVVILYARVLWFAMRQFNRDFQHLFLLLALIQLVGMAFLSPLISSAHAQLGSVFVLLYVGIVAGRSRGTRVRNAVPVRSYVAAERGREAAVAMRWRRRVPEASSRTAKL